MDFQFDWPVDRKAIAIASMIDEQSPQPLLNIAEQSITAQRPAIELDETFALWDGSPMVQRIDDGPVFISTCYN